MRGRVGLAALAVAVGVLSGALSAGAGEILLQNGTRVQGELGNDVLALSTGSGLVEVAPAEVRALTREEAVLWDGRVIRGSLVGGSVKAKTAIGEVTIKAEDFRAFRSGGSTPRPEAGLARGAVAAAEPAPARAVPAALGSGDQGLPSLSAYQEPAAPSSARPPVSTGPTLAALPPASAPAAGERLEVVTAESVLYRDAFAGAKRVGHVTRGQEVVYLDRIDRRLRVLDFLVFDGGYWIKVRASDGAEGWVPATAVREVR